MPIVMCPECPSTLSVSSSWPYRLTHNPDGSHTAQIAPADSASPVPGIQQGEKP